MYKIFFFTVLEMDDETLLYLVNGMTPTDRPLDKPEGAIAVHVDELVNKDAAALKAMFRKIFDDRDQAWEEREYFTIP